MTYPSVPAGTERHYASQVAPSYAATGLTGAVAASRYAGATTSGAPSSGNFAAGDYVVDQTGHIWVCTTAGSPGTWADAGSNLDGTAAHIQPDGTQTAGANGIGTDSGHIHPDSLGWNAADYGLLAQNFDAAVCTTTSIVIAGTVLLLRLNIRQAMTITYLYWNLQGNGNNTGGSGGTFTGLYSSSGSLLTGSSDVASSLATGSPTAVKLTLATAQPLSAGTFVWAALLCNLGTTQPTFARAGATLNTMNVLTSTLGGGTARAAAYTTGSQAVLPLSFTPASQLSVTNGLPLWVGAS